MKRIVSTEKRQVCASEYGLFNYFAWPSVTRLPDGTLALTASGFRLKHICPFGKAVICYSRDEGAHWTPPTPVIDTPLDDRDCGITTFGKGRVIITSFNNTLDFQAGINARSAGDTAVDLARKRLVDAYIDYARALGGEADYIGSTYRISEDGGYSFGKLRRSPVTAPHGPLGLNDGSLLYIGRRFSSDNSDDGGERPYIECWKLNARDEFEYVSAVPNCLHTDAQLLSCEPHAVQLEDGRIILHIRAQSGSGAAKRVFTVYQSESYDGGLSFSEPRQIIGDTAGSPPHLLQHTSGALICVYGRREPPYGQRAMFSRDGGANWDTDYILDDSAANPDLGYPATVELKDGRLLTVYYENTGGRSSIMQQIWELPE